MKVKTSELTGAALDWAVAAARIDGAFEYYATPGWSPSSNWAHGGPIIEHERIGLWCDGGDGWAAEDYIHAPVYGPTPLIAAMRCYVASKLGDEVDVPEELK